MKNGEGAAVGHARVVSAVPGRIRVKIHSKSRDPVLMKKIQMSVRDQEGIHHVKVNHNTGSVTIRYDHQRHTEKGVMRLLEDFDKVFQSIGQEADFAKSESSANAGFASSGFLESLNDLNRGIYAATGVPINLKVLMPLAFAGAGIWSISKRGLMIEAVPGWLFLWFAFDMFVKLHPSEHARQDDRTGERV